MSRTYVDIEAVKEVLADERRKIDEYMRNVAHIDISEYLYYYEKEQNEDKTNL